MLSGYNSAGPIVPALQFRNLPLITMPAESIKYSPANASLASAG